MEGPGTPADQSDPCAICLGAMGAGGGQAIFTAECSHTFHFNCISASVAHGNLVCPLCNAHWTQLPFVRPPPPQPMPPQPMPRPPPPQPWPPVQPVFLPAELQVFDDDEQVEPPPSGQREADSASTAAAAAATGTLAVTTHAERSALASGSSHDGFAVLVHLKAPGITSNAAPRAPLDLVTVLDVSGSMGGRKLALLKQAMAFVVDNLGPGDRLSVVSFSSAARRVTRLLRMTDAGKAAAMDAVGALAARGGTNIAEGLRTAARVLGERRHRNAVSSVVLLSDGQDNYTMPQSQGRYGHGGGAPPNYEALVPPSFAAPIHTFGFGNDHDAAAMHVVAEATGGTFSFIENEAVIQDAFAQCIGGLLTVVAQETRVAIACGHPGIRIGSVKSGRYESRVDEDGRAASIRVGELYADEERRFLLFLSVPTADGAEAEATIIKVSSSYRDAAGGATVNVAAADTVVARPEQVADDAGARSVEVERERVRVEAAEDIAAARAAAERGEYEEAVGILERRQRAVAEFDASSGGGDPTSLALGAELQEMRLRVVSRESYHLSGRALMLSGMSTHAQQRANSRQLRPTAAVEGMISPPGGAPPAMMVKMGLSGAAPGAMWNEAERMSSFATPAMRAMMDRSRRSREASGERPKPKAAGDAASSAGPMDAGNQ